MSQPRWFAHLAPLLALALAAPAAQAMGVTLRDGGAVVDFDGESREGLTSWTVDGIRHMRQQGFWIRAGSDAAEVSFADLDLTSLVASDSDMDGDDDRLTADYQDPAGRFAVTLDVALTGLLGSPSAGSESDIVLELFLTNTGAAPLDVTLFQYTDVDLFGSFSDDSAVFSGMGAALDIDDSTGLARYAADFGPTPDAVEASLFDALLASLEDGGATTLSGALSASGDVTTAASWSRTLGVDTRFDLLQTQSIRVDPVSAPEPAGLLAIGLTLAAFGSRARREL